MQATTTTATFGCVPGAYCVVLGVGGTLLHRCHGHSPRASYVVATARDPRLHTAARRYDSREASARQRALTEAFLSDTDYPL
jgi:hypothetical protein